MLTPSIHCLVLVSHFNGSSPTASPCALVALVSPIAAFLITSLYNARTHIAISPHAKQNSFVICLKETNNALIPRWLALNSTAVMLNLKRKFIRNQHGWQYMSAVAYRVRSEHHKTIKLSTQHASECNAIYLLVFFALLFWNRVRISYAHKTIFASMHFPSGFAFYSPPFLLAHKLKSRKPTATVIARCCFQCFNSRFNHPFSKLFVI